MFGLIAPAYAEGAAPAPQGGGMEMIIMLAVFGLVFYFLIYRPQAKRNKEHRNLMASIGKGDEVLTSGGLLGRVTKVSDDNDYIEIALNDTTSVVIKKDFVSAVLPKGTIKSL